MDTDYKMGNTNRPPHFVTSLFIRKWISYTYTDIPISPLSCISLPPSLSHPSRWSQSTTDLLVLCSCFPLAIYFTFGSVYMSMPLSHFVPAYPYPSLCPQVHSLCLHLYYCLAPRFFRTFFFFFLRLYIYVLAYSICFSLSDLFHSVWQTLGPSTSLQITQFRFFLWLSNIPLYICATASLSIHLSIDHHILINYNLFWVS